MLFGYIIPGMLSLRRPMTTRSESVYFRSALYFLPIRYLTYSLSSVFEYESKGATTRCRLGLGFSAERVQQCDMLENPESDLALEENVTALSFRPFEIVTLRVSEE